MPTYRRYTIGLNGRISGPPSLVQASDDDAALSEAAADVTAAWGAEVWLGARMIGKLPPARAFAPATPRADFQVAG